ncbi:MAG: GTP-binding protein [Betaproteobacteria bacterium]|nr:GTP-binding protein [Betaproteobacteria bacterium]
MSFQRDPLAGKIPVTLITGFLGSGKTTLISRLVRHPDMNRVAVVINEVGEIGIDHDLVSQSSENISLLANGCICCSVRTDLQETLRDLFARRQVGEVFDFDRVIIETTGLADPAPVIQTLISDTLIGAQFRLDGLVALVDAVNGLSTLDTQPEAVKQVAVADRLFISKSDLATPEGLASLQQRLSDLNPQATPSLVVHGDLPPRALIGLGLASARAGEHTMQFLGESLADTSTDTSRAGRYLGERSPPHDPSIRTLSLRFQQPFAWSAFSSALDLLTQMRGPDLLRVKGIVNVEGKPVVVQGVQHLFHPPVELDRWPSDDHDSRLVFITRHIEADVIRRLFEVVGQLGLGTPQPVATSSSDERNTPRSTLTS